MNRSIRTTLAVLLLAAAWVGGPVSAGTDISAADREIVERFEQLWRRNYPVFPNRFLGVQTLQNPFDVWITQEIMYDVKPDFIVETGTYHGGSAALWAMYLEQMNPAGRVITVDIEDRRREAKDLPISRRKVDFLLGSSTAPEIVAEIARRVKGKKVLVILDSLHTREHVLAELRAYAPLVSVGSYVIVQDTNAGGIHGVHEFVAENPNFEIDRSKERLLVTNNDDGFLRRVR